MASRVSAERKQATANIYEQWAEQRFKGEVPDADVSPEWVDAQVDKLISDRMTYPMRPGVPYYTRQESGDIENVDAAELWRAGEFGEALKEPFRPQLKRPDRDRAEGVGAGVGAKAQFEIDQLIYGDIAKKYGIEIPNANALSDAEFVSAQRDMYEDFTYYGYARDPEALEEWHRKYDPEVIEQANNIFKNALRAPALPGENVANAKKARSDFMLQQHPVMVQRQEEARKDFDRIQEQRQMEFIDDITRVATNRAQERLLEEGIGRTLAHGQPDSEVLAAWAKQIGIQYTEKWIETNLPRLNQDAKRRNQAEFQRVTKRLEDWKQASRDARFPARTEPAEWEAAQNIPKEYYAMGRATKAGTVESPLEGMVMGLTGAASRAIWEPLVIAPFTWDVHPDGTPVDPDDLTLKQHEASVRIIRDYEKKRSDPEYWESTSKTQQAEDWLQAFAATFRPGGLPIQRTEGPTGMPGIVSQHNGVKGIANSVMMNVLSGMEKRRWAPDDIDAIEGLGTVAKTAAVMFELGIPATPWGAAGFALEAPRGVASAAGKSVDAYLDSFAPEVRGRVMDGVNVLYPHPDNVAKAFGETPVSLKMTTGDAYQNAIEFLSSPIAYMSVKTDTAGKAAMMRSFAKGAAARGPTLRGWKYSGLPEVAEAMENLNVGMMGARSLVRAVTANFQGEDLIRYLEDAADRSPNAKMKEGLEKAVLDLKASPELLRPENALKAEDVVTLELYNSMLRAYGDTVFANDGMDVIMKASTKQRVKRPAEAKTRTIANVKGTSKVNIREEINNSPFTIDDFDKRLFNDETHAWRMSLDMPKLEELYAYEINGVRYERPPPAAVKRDINQINTHGLATTAMQHRVFNWIEAAEMQRLAIRDFDDGVARMVTPSDISRFNVPAGPPLSTPVEAWRSLRPNAVKSAVEALPGKLDEFLETDIPYFSRTVQAASEINFPRFIGGGPGRRIPLYTLGRNLGVRWAGGSGGQAVAAKLIDFIPSEFEVLRNFAQKKPERFVNPGLWKLVKDTEQSIYNINSEFRDLIIESNRGREAPQKAFLDVIDAIVIKSQNDPLIEGSARRFFENTLGYFLDVKGRETSLSSQLVGKQKPKKKVQKPAGEDLTADDLVKIMDAYSSMKKTGPFNSVYNLPEVLEDFVKELRTAVKTKKGELYNRLQDTLGPVSDRLGGLQTGMLQSVVDAAQGMKRDHFFAAIEAAAKNEMAMQKYNNMVRDILDMYPDMVRKLERLPEERKFDLPSGLTNFETHEEMYRLYISNPIRKMVQERFGDQPQKIAMSVLTHFFNTGDVTTIGAQNALRKSLEADPVFQDQFIKLQQFAARLVPPARDLKKPIPPTGYKVWTLTRPMDPPVRPDPTKLEGSALELARLQYEEDLYQWTKATENSEKFFQYEKDLAEWTAQSEIMGDVPVTEERLAQWKKWDGSINPETMPEGMGPNSVVATLRQYQQFLQDKTALQFYKKPEPIPADEEVFKPTKLNRLVRQKLNKGVESKVQRRVDALLKEWKDSLREEIMTSARRRALASEILEEQGIFRDPDASENLVTPWDRRVMEIEEELIHTAKGRKLLEEEFSRAFENYFNSTGVREAFQQQVDEIWTEEVMSKIDEIIEEVDKHKARLEEPKEGKPTIATITPVYERPADWGASPEMQKRVQQILAAGDVVPSGFRVRYMKDGKVLAEVNKAAKAENKVFLDTWLDIRIPGASAIEEMGGVSGYSVAPRLDEESGKILWEKIEEATDPRWATHSTVAVMAKDFKIEEAIKPDGVFALIDARAAFSRLSKDRDRMDLIINQAIDDSIFRLTNNTATDLLQSVQKMGFPVGVSDNIAMLEEMLPQMQTLKEGIYLMGDPLVNDLIKQIRTKAIEGKLVKGLEKLRKTYPKKAGAKAGVEHAFSSMAVEMYGFLLASRRSAASGLMGLSPRYQGTNIATWPLIQMVTNPSMVARTMFDWATSQEAKRAMVLEFPQGTGVGRVLQKGLDKTVEFFTQEPTTIKDSWAISFERAWDKYMFGYDTDAVFTAPNGKTYTAKDLDDLMNKKGVFDSFVKFEFSDQDIEETMRVARLDKDLSERGWLKQVWAELDPRNKNVFNRAAQAMDNSYRRAAFIAALSMGLDETSAGIIAKTSNLDYSRTSDFEKQTIAKWRLFYSFQRNMMVETLEAFLRGDFSAGAMLKWYRNQENYKRQIGTYATQPDYGENRAFVFPHKLSGSKAMDYGAAGWAGPGVPFLDSIKTINTIASHLDGLVFDTKNYLSTTKKLGFGGAAKEIEKFLLAVPETDLLRHLMDSVDDGSKYGAFLNPKLVLRAKHLGDWDNWVKKYDLVRVDNPIVSNPEFYDEFTGEFEQYRFGSPEKESDFKWNTYYALVANIERVPNEYAVFHTLWTGEVPKGAKLKRFEKNRWMAVLYLAGLATPINLTDKEQEHLMLLKTLEKGISE